VAPVQDAIASANLSKDSFEKRKMVEVASIVSQLLQYHFLYRLQPIVLEDQTQLACTDRVHLELRRGINATKLFEIAGSYPSPD